MSNWTQINCCVRGEFTKNELEKLFGKPILDYHSKYKFPYDSKEYKEQEKLIEKLYNQCKLPFGEEPLNYKFIRGSRGKSDADILIIWGSLRWFEMSNTNQYKQIEDIVKNILAQFPYSVRQLTMQAYDEFSKKTYIWSSVFNSEPILTILEKKIKNNYRNLKI